MAGKKQQPLAEEIGFLIAQNRRLIWQAAAKRLEGAGESLLVWQLLTRVVNGGPTTQRALADSMGQHPAGVCRLLDDLEERGWIARVRDTEDRRCMQVRVTTQGRARHAQVRPFIAEAVQSMLGQLSDSERVVLRDLLKKLAVANSQPAEPVANPPRARRKAAGKPTRKPKQLHA